MLKLVASGPISEKRIRSPRPSVFSSDQRKSSVFLGEPDLRRNSINHSQKSNQNEGETRQDKEIENHLNVLVKSFACKERKSFNRAETIRKAIQKVNLFNHQSQSEGMINVNIHVNNLFVSYGDNGPSLGEDPTPVTITDQKTLYTDFNGETMSRQFSD